MEVRQGTAVYYEDTPNHLVLAYVETVKVRQVSSEWIQGKELAIITDLADEECDSIEVILTMKNVFALKTQIKRIAEFASGEEYNGLPRGCIWRRTISKSTPHKAVPLCICGNAVQSDTRTVRCHVCEAVSHLECVSKGECPKCGEQLPGVSRKASREVERPSPIRASSEDERKTPSAYVQVTKYPLLTTQFATRLQQRLIKLTSESAKIQARIDDSEIPRQIFKDKVFSALLLSQAECDSLDNGHKSTAKVMLEITIEVENAVFEFANSHAKSNVYTQKARMLAFNLLDVKNPDFRGGLLRKEISPANLPLMDSKDVASSSLKRHREIKEKELLKDKVISPEIQQKVIVKSHKGEGVLVFNQISTVKPLDCTPIPVKPTFDLPKSPSKRPETDHFPANPAPILPSKSDRKPWIPAAVYETVFENSPEKLSAMLKRRFEDYLRPYQADNLRSNLP